MAVRVGLIVVVLLALSAGVAAAFWSANATAGGSGAAAATQLDRGATPTATVEPGGSTVTVTWTASTLRSGQAVGGYRVLRYPTGLPAAQTMLTGCAGTVTGLTCTETGVPTGSWEYTLTPVLAAHWRGPESGRSAPASTGSTTPPVNALSLSDVSGGAARSGDTVYYRGAAAGSFTVTNAVTDVDPGPASSTTTALTGGSTGWSHSPSTVSAPAGGPFVSNPFTWSAGASGSPSEAVTSRDGAGNTATTTLTYTDDSAPPTGGTLSYPGGYQSDPTVDVTTEAGTDAGSGFATRQLQRSTAVLAAGLCDTFGAFTDVGPDNPASPFTDATLTDQRC